MKMQGYLRKFGVTVLAFLLGALAVLAIPPYHFLPILFISMSAALLLWHYANGWLERFIISTAYCYGYFQLGLLWFSQAFFTPEQNSVSIPLLLSICLTPLVLSLLYGFILAFADMIPLKKTGRFFIFAAAYSVSAWFTSTVFPGVPANLLGYVWDFNLPSLQILAIIGIYGLTFLTVLIASVPAIFWLPGSLKLKLGLATAITLIAILIYTSGIIRLAGEPTRFVPDLQLRLVQTLISYEQKSKSLEELLDKMIPLTTQAGYDKINYVFWPEDVIDSFLIPGRVKTQYVLERLIAAAPKHGAIIFGTGRGILKPGIPINSPLHGSLLKKRFNSICVVDDDKQKMLDDCYDQTELIPFAEYNPFSGLIKLPNALDFLHQRQVKDTFDYNKGPGKRTMSIGRLPPVSPLICYEVFFSHKVVGPDQPRPAWLFTAANDYYFRSTIGIATHLTNARARAIEEGLPIVFVANAGTSAVIDAYGRIVKKLPPMSEGIIDSGLPIATAKPTLYATYGQTGFLMLLICGIIIAILIEIKY